MKENMVTTIGAMAAGFLIVITFMLGVGVDRKGPEITFLYDITYSEGQDISVLLDGVSAIDGRDGDVTVNVMVDSLIVLNENQFAKVTYVAKDRSNNITKASRVVAYEGSGRSIYSTSASETITKTADFSETVSHEEPPVLDILETASQMTQEGETTRGEEETESAQTSAEEETTTETQTPSNAEETTKEPETTALYMHEAPMITLSAREVTINAGERFNIALFVSSITDNKDSREALYRRIGIDGKYDVGAAGTYTFKVYCIDSDRNVSNKESFTLHVREAEQEQ